MGGTEEENLIRKCGLDGKDWGNRPEMILRDDTIEGRNRGAQTGDPQGGKRPARRREEEPGDILRERNKGNKNSHGGNFENGRSNAGGLAVSLALWYKYVYAKEKR